MGPTSDGVCVFYCFEPGNKYEDIYSLMLTLILPLRNGPLQNRAGHSEHWLHIILCCAGV